MEAEGERAELQAMVTPEGKKMMRKKTKMVRVSQGEIDIIMATPPRRSFPRPSAEKIRAATDPADPEELRFEAELLELFDSVEKQMNAWDDEEESIRRQFLAKGMAEIEVITDDEEEPAA